MHTDQSLYHNLLVFILLVNSIYWSIFPHSWHCAFVKSMGISKCPSHIYHIVFGIMCFFGAIWVEQGNFFNPKNWD
jgi:hypothetical protein